MSLLETINFDLLKQVNKTDKKCSKHGTPLVEFNGQTFCPTCQKEQTQQQNDERVSQQAEKHHRRKTVEILRKDSIVGDKDLWHASFKNFEVSNQETEEALYRARHIAGEYLKAEHTFNTVLTGIPGTGKSHLAMSILKAVNDNADPYISCLFISVNDLLRLIKDSISNPESVYKEDRMVKQLSNVDLLVLDDLGSESSFKQEASESSEYNQKILFGILNARRNTIITTNLSSDELENIYNQKIISRLYKGVEGHIIKFTEETADKRSKIKF